MFKRASLLIVAIGLLAVAIFSTSATRRLWVHEAIAQEKDDKQEKKPGEAEEDAKDKDEHAKKEGHKEEADKEKKDEKDEGKHKDEKDEGKHEEGKEEAEHEVIHRSYDAQGRAVLEVKKETQEKIGLAVQPLAAATSAPERIAYGVLEQDPSQSFVVRAPFAGVLRAAADHPWPQIGESVADGTSVGVVQPRFGPLERFDLISKRTAARGEVEQVQAELAAAKASYENKKQLNQQGNKLVSDRAVEEALAKVQADEARLKTAIETADQLDKALTSITQGAPGEMPLTVERGGEVAEVLAAPGEAVESGTPLMRVARFDNLLARVEIPAGETIDLPIRGARVIPVGHDDWVMPAKAVGVAPDAGPRTHGIAFLLRVRGDNHPLRPGTAVTATLELPGEAATGVIVPRSSVIRFGGKTWVYMQTGDEQFTRTEVALESPRAEGWFVRSGVSAGDKVVITGAQPLLSQELLGQIEAEEEASE